MKIFELKSTAEVQQLETSLDNIMRPVGLDVEFTQHFIERLMGRDKMVSADQIAGAFMKLKQKYKRKLLSAKKKADYTAVLKDFDSDLNVVFAIQPGPDGPELVNITMMKKPVDQFRSTNFDSEDLKVGRPK